MDRVDDIIKKAKTGALNPLQKAGGTGPLKAPGQQPPQGKQPEIGKDRGNTGFDPTTAMKNTGRLPSLGGDDIPKVGNDALEGLRKGTGQLGNVFGNAKKGGTQTLDKLKDLMAKGEKDVTGAANGVAKGAENAWNDTVKGVGKGVDGVKSVKDELGHAAKGVSAVSDVYAIAQNAKAFMYSDDVIKAAKIAAEGADLLDDAAKVGKMGKFMAGVGVALAVADLAYQSYRASQWDTLKDNERASVCLNMAGSTLAIVGTFCPPPVNFAVLGVGAAFSLAALAADYWPEISAFGEKAGAEIADWGKQAGKDIANFGKDAGKEINKAAETAAAEAKKAKEAAEKAIKDAADKTAKEAKAAAEKAAAAAKAAAEKAAAEAKAAAESAARAAAEAAKKAVSSVKKVAKKLKFW